MEMIGRITANATVKTTNSGKEVVNFSIAINDRYKAKDGEPVEMVTYVNCSYWVSSKMAQYLAKGTLVELSGRISVNAYNNMDGEARASLNFHVNDIKLHGKPSGATIPVTAAQPSGQQVAEVMDDLPF